MSFVSAEYSHNVCPFLDFPSENTMYIFGFLGPVALACCARVCKTWQGLAAEESLWKDLCEREQLALYKKASWEWKKTYLVFSFSGKELSHFLNIKEPETWQAHEASISSLYLNDTTLVSGDIDGMISLWDLSNEKPKNEKTWETCRVNSLQLKETTLFVGTFTAKIECWDLTTSKLIKTLSTTHIGVSVRCLELQETNLVSGCHNAIQTWNISSGECMKTFMMNSSSIVNAVQFDGTTLISGGVGGVIYVWDMSTGKCQKTLRVCNGGVFSLQLHETTLVSGCYQSIQIWDLNSGTCVETMEAHSKGVHSLQLQGKILVSASSDQIKIWDLSLRTCLKTLDEACDVVRFQGTTLVCGTREGTIKIWKDLLS